MTTQMLCALELIGTDAETLLQNQITGDIKKADGHQTLFTAICDLKGRVLATLLLHRVASDGFIIITHSGIVAALQAHLDKYLRFSRSKLTQSPMHVGVGLPHHGQPFSVSSDNGENVIINHPSGTLSWHLSPTMKNHDIELTAADIASGLIWVTPSISATYLPQVLGLERFDGISYNKGCYLGQEVVARVHFLGKPKQHLVKVTFPDTGTTTLEASALDDQKGKTVGAVVIRDKNQGLAILSTRHTDAVYTTNGVPLSWQTIERDEAEATN